LSSTPDAKFIVSGSKDNTVRLWGLEKGEYIKPLEGHIKWILSVCITPDARFAVSDGLDKTLRLWDLKRGECIKILKGHAFPRWPL
jgi:WD40 repeat protein